jgi:hypothetical protein
MDIAASVFRGEIGAAGTFKTLVPTHISEDRDLTSAMFGVNA